MEGGKRREGRREEEKERERKGMRINTSKSVREAAWSELTAQGSESSIVTPEPKQMSDGQPRVQVRLRLRLPVPQIPLHEPSNGTAIMCE